MLQSGRDLPPQGNALLAQHWLDRRHRNITHSTARPCNSCLTLADPESSCLDIRISAGCGMPDALPPDRSKTPRQRWMAVLARADAEAVQSRLGSVPHYTVLRGPEAGLVMVRGRTGGGGAPFNLGEMTATRCTVRTDTGLVGHAYVAGRNERLAELAALADALLQDPAYQARIHEAVIEPLAALQQAMRDTTAAKAAATRVQFFA